MMAIYPYRWAGQFADTKAVMVAKSEWADALAEFSDEEIKHGLSRCRNEGNEFPPSIPQFIQYCLPTVEDLNLPAPDEAYQLAYVWLRNEADAHPIIKNVVELIGRYEFRMKSEKEVKPQFMKIYKQLCERERKAHRPLLAVNQQTQGKITHD